MNIKYSSNFELFPVFLNVSGFYKLIVYNVADRKPLPHDELSQRPYRVTFELLDTFLAWYRYTNLT